MQINPSIILSGQQPDFVNTLARSTQAAQMANQNRDQNALRQLFQTQGPQIMAGEGNALNSLARIDPNAALGIQGARQDMQAQQQRMGILSAAEKRAVQEHAMRMSAAERDQEIERTRQGLLMGMKLFKDGNLPGLNQMLAGFDLEPLQSLDDFPYLAARYDGFLKTLTELRDYEAGPKPADEYQRYAQEEARAGRKPLTRIEYEQAKKGRGLDIQLPDGTRVSQGGAANPKFTESQSKDNVYSTRARGALEAFEPVAETLTSRGQQIAERAPLGLGRELQTDEFQIAKQSGTEFLQAILRKDTGAAITQQETESYGAVYLPQPGDGPGVLEAKRQARIRAVAALESGMSAAQMLARDRALIKAAEEGGGAQSNAPSAPSPGVTEDGYRFLGGDPGDPKNWEKVD